jgi:hypothetical protein
MSVYIKNDTGGCCVWIVLYTGCYELDTYGRRQKQYSYNNFVKVVILRY